MDLVIAGAVGLAAAIDYLGQIGLDAIAAHEHMLLIRATDKAQAQPGMRIIGTASDKAAILSFELDGIHPHDVGTILDSAGVAIRTGHHCAMPLVRSYDVVAAARASFYIYNTKHEIDELVNGISETEGYFVS